ncbi:ATP-binding protein [Kitasatospora sp. NPDC002040]|uniref:sensor histidine kinase n=1 Tax=Kitasatospora sp. NPDC002040 TaxID=3154661 RepID=UPI00332E7890
MGTHAGPPAREATAATRPPAAHTLLRRLRPRTVRARIVALLMVPVVSVMALWSFATVTTAQQIWDLLRLQEVHAELLDPVAGTVTALQAERVAAGQQLAAPGAGREAVLREAADTTDRAIAPLGIGSGWNRADARGLGAEAASRVDALGTAVGGLAELRRRLAERSVSWADTYAAYTAAIDRALDVTGATTGLQDHRVASDARVLLEFARSRELLAREDALLRTGQRAGAVSDPQRAEFAAVVYARRLLEQTAGRDLRPADRSALLAVVNGPDHRELIRQEDAVRAAADGRGAAEAVSAEQWSLTADGVARALRAVETDAGAAAAARTRPYALGLFSSSGAAVLLGLVAVVASLLISVQIGRSLVTELIALRNSALELAGRKLPGTMRRLRAGEEIDVETEAPLRPHGEDEIGQVHGALGSVQRAAVTAAVERAEVLSGVSGVFVNLARRSQVLVHRQLTLLDTMERRTEDPEELEDLFRLDHLTTRMRRHAEGLIILSGAAPGRGWRNPVPLMDVVRAAVSEVEEYARVEVHRLPYAAVAGQAVADLTHLVAELVENATGFSPPHTKVHVRGEQVGNGYALEIEDRGLGMGPEALADANRRIGAAQQVDLFDSDRLGLFVVSRLARRQDVRVSLRTSAYGGTTAVVLLPNALLESPRSERPGAAGPEAPELELTELAPPPPPPSQQPVFRTPPRLAAVPPVPVAPPAAVPPSIPPDDDLPRRVRQASLAPQLREAPERPRIRARPDTPPLIGRNPEEARAAMSAYQRGWARGKNHRTVHTTEGENR